jgi:ribosomal protein S25
VKLEKIQFVSSGKTFEVNSRVLEKLERYMNKNSYAYLGSISVEIGHNISYTETVLNELSYRGYVKQLSQKEKLSLQIDDRCSVWVLNSTAKLSKAFV